MTLVKSLVVSDLKQLTSPSLLSSNRRRSSGAKRKPVAIGLISLTSCELRTGKIAARTSAVHAGAERPGLQLRRSESTPRVRGGEKLQPARRHLLAIPLDLSRLARSYRISHINASCNHSFETQAGWPNASCSAKAFASARENVRPAAVPTLPPPGQPFVQLLRLRCTL